MCELTTILSRIESGDPVAAEKLLPLVYEELRKIATSQMAKEKPNHTLQGTALVHEAYLRLLDGNASKAWDGRRHFLAAAAEAMRRILVENARRKSRLKHGGNFQRQDATEVFFSNPNTDPTEIISIHEALDDLAKKSPRKAELVKLRFFLGLTMKEAATALGISVSTAEDDWTYAKAWLQRRCK